MQKVCNLLVLIAYYLQTLELQSASSSSSSTLLLFQSCGSFLGHISE